MKRKLLCIAVAIIMILPLAFAAIPMASAAVADGWEHTATGGASASNFKVNADGSLSMGWGNPEVPFANLGALYDASAYNNNYTITVEAYVPATQSASTTNGVPVVGVMGVYPDGADKNWTGAMSVKLANYEGTAAGTPDNYAAWGTYNVVELFDTSAKAVACAASPYSIIGIESGDWNTVKVVVANGVVSMWVNDVLVCNAYTPENATGKYVVLGSNGDCGDWNNMPSFRNFKIVSNDDSVADYEAYTYVEPTWNTSAANNATAAINADGTLSIGAGAWSGAAISSLKGVAFDSGNNISLDIFVPNQALTDDTGKDAGTCFQNFSVMLSTAANTTVPSTAAGSCVQTTNGDSIEFRLVNNLANQILLYTYVNGACVNSGVSLADKVVSAIKVNDVNSFIFSIDGADVNLYANGTLIYTFANAASIFSVDGIAVLGFGASTYGGNTTGTYIISDISGFVPNNYGLWLEVPAEFDPADSNWTVLAPWMADATTPGGIVSYKPNGIIKLNSNTGNWGQAGVVYNEKLFASRLEIVINKTANTFSSPNAHTDFILSATKPTTYSLQMSVNTYFPDCNPATALAIHVGGDNVIYGSGVVGAIAFTNAWSNDVDNTFSVGDVYEVDGNKYVKIYLNGAALQIEEIDPETEEPTGAYVDYEFNVTNVLDENNQAYVIVGQTGYGTSGATAEFKAINGITAGKYEGADAYYNETENKATTPVVQWRAPSEKVAAGLRFKTTVALNSVNNNDSIVKMGTIIMPADKVTGGYLGHTQDGKIDGTSYLDIVAKNYYEKTDDSISFTAVLIGIPEDQLSRIFLAVSYVEYADGTITYGGLRAVSINDAMNA